MTIDVYIEGWDEQENPSQTVRCEQLYELDNEYFEGYGYEKDSDGFYVDTVVNYTYPTINITSSNLQSIFDSVGVHFSCSEGEVPAKDIPELTRKFISAVNSKEKIQKGIRDDYIDGNFHSIGTSDTYVKERLNNFINLLLVAKKEGKGIYWC